MNGIESQLAAVTAETSVEVTPPVRAAIGFGNEERADRQGLSVRQTHLLLFANRELNQAPVRPDVSRLSVTKLGAASRAEAVAIAMRKHFLKI